MTCPEWKNIGLTLGAIRKTSFWFDRHVMGHQPKTFRESGGRIETSIESEGRCPYKAGGLGTKG